MNASENKLHGEISPADIRPQDSVSCWIRHLDSLEEPIQVQVWQLSPLGIALVCPADVGDRFESGTLVKLSLLISGQRSSHTGVVVEHFPSETNTPLFGVRFVVAPAENSRSDRRGSTRWLCSNSFLPTSMAATPGKFDDFMYFQITDISQSGARLLTSLRNKYLVPGMRLSLTTVFPMGSVALIPVNITRVSVTSLAGRDRLVVGVSFEELSELARRAIGQYLLQFGADAVSSKELQEAGFIPSSIALGVDFRNVQSDVDYESVLQLRLRAHMRDGNVEQGVDHWQLGDRQDANSRIIAGFYKGKVVATARLQFDGFEDLALVDGQVGWPKELPRRDEIIEVSRVATDPGFRAGDLLAALFRICCVNVVNEQRPWILISCLEGMVPFYEKLGFVNTGVKHSEPLWVDDRVLTVMVANSLETMLGRRVNPFYWNFVYSPAAEQLQRSGVLRPKGMDRIRIKVFRLLGLMMFTSFFRRRPRKD